MAFVITIQGIDQAISNLNYTNKKALKYRLVNTIRGYYADESSIESIPEIDTDELVKVLWNTGDDPKAIKNRRRNLNSIKSSVNADLKRLYEEGKNPEGIAIGSTNIFALSDEARNKVLEAFKNKLEVEGTITLNQITDILTMVNEILSKPEALTDTKNPEGPLKLDQLRSLMQGLWERLGLEGPDAAEGSEELEEVEDIEELDEDEVIEDLEDVDIDDAAEEAEIAEDLEAEEDIEDVDEVEETEEAEIAEDLEAEEDIEDVDEVEETEEAEIAEDLEAEEDIEEVEDLEELDEHEVIEDLEDVDIDDETEEAEIEEDLEAEDELEEVESEDELEEADEVAEAGETDISMGDLGDGYSDGGYEGDDETKKARVLAEEFNNLTGAMDRFYNQYLLIPDGEYIVGSNRPKKVERPEQKVHLTPFYMGKFPVTNALFEIFVQKTGYMTTAEKTGYGTVFYGRSQKKVDKKTGLKKLTWNSSLINKEVKRACWYQPLGPGSTLHNKRNHPVVQVSLEDAMAFAAWTGKRLPTEDEWEAASRTAHGYVFPWGKDWKKESCNIEESYIGDTTPVDKYIGFANDLEIVDTIGNVLEWILVSSKSPSYVKNGSKYYIAKGGSWISGNNIQLFSRFNLEPESHSNILGFRCVAY